MTTTTPLVSPKVDTIFKALFGSEKNKSALISLLNAVLERETKTPITAIELLNTELPLRYQEERRASVDVRATTQDGEIFHIEMQCQQHQALAERLLYYWSRLYSEQLSAGKQYQALRPVYTILFTDFAMFQKRRDYRSCWMWREQDGQTLSTHGQIHIFELPKFQADPNELESTLEKWLSFLKDGNTMSTHTIEAWENAEIAEAFAELERMSADPALRQEYEARRNYLLEQNTMLYEHYMNGLEEGRTKGLEEGRTKGLEEGRRVVQAALAQRLLEAGQAQERVAELLELSTEALTALLAASSDPAHTEE